MGRGSNSTVMLLKSLMGGISFHLEPTVLFCDSINRWLVTHQRTTRLSTLELELTTPNNNKNTQFNDVGDHWS